MQGNNCGQIWGTIPVMSSWNWEKTRKHFVRIAGPCSENGTSPTGRRDKLLDRGILCKKQVQSGTIWSALQCLIQTREVSCQDALQHKPLKRTTNSSFTFFWCVFRHVFNIRGTGCPLQKLQKVTAYRVALRPSSRRLYFRNQENNSGYIWYWYNCQNIGQI